jgi:hypothetical protein
VRTIEHWIDGRATPGSSTRSAPVYDPSSGQQQAQVVLASTDDVQEAVASAKRAFEEWGQASLSKRTKVLFAFREIMARRAKELAEVVSDEHGKVVSDAFGEVQRGLEVVEFACGIPQLLKGEYSDQVSTGVDVFSFREPLGVVAGITPFNFPVMVPMWMHPVAIACGNTFVLKPSERDPSASMLVAEMWKEAGLPDGVFTVLHGDKEAVDGLLEHPDVRVGHHDGVVLRAAQGLDSLAVFRAAPVDVLGDRGGADERHRRDARVVEDRVHRDLVTVDDAEHAVRQPGVGVQLGDEVRDRRVALAGLEDERVPGGDRHRVHPHGHHDREVEGRDARDDPEGLAERQRVDVGGDLVGVVALEEAGQAAGELGDLHAADDLALGVRHGLAVLGRDDPRHLVGVLVDEVAEGEHDPHAAGQRHLPPGFERLAGGGDGRVDVGGLGEQHLRLLLPGGRVVDGGGAR